MPRKIPTITVTIQDDGRYLIIAKRGLEGQRRKRLSITPDEAPVLLAQLAGLLRARRVA